MKTVAVIGSPRGMDGNTGALLRVLLGAVERNGSEVQVFSLAGMKVGPCRGCGVCHKTGKCAVKDDFGRIRDAILDADAVVLASPNYIFSVSAQMKAFIDRCCGPLHCQALRDKYGAAVVTSGGGGTDEVEEYLLRFLRVMGCWIEGSVGAQAAQLADPAEAATVMSAAAHLGAGLAEDIKERPALVEHSREREEFAERMKKLVTLRKKEWPFEYDFWFKQTRAKKPLSSSRADGGRALKAAAK